jgi:hypothetical protein
MTSSRKRSSLHISSLAHLVQKPGGADNIIMALARSNIRNGTLLLAIGASVSVIGYLASGNL